MTAVTMPSTGVGRTRTLAPTIASSASRSGCPISQSSATASTVKPTYCTAVTETTAAASRHRGGSRSLTVAPSRDEHRAPRRVRADGVRRRPAEPLQGVPEVALLEAQLEPAVLPDRPDRLPV